MPRHMSRIIIVFSFALLLHPARTYSQDTLSLVHSEDMLLDLYDAVLNEAPFEKEEAGSNFYNKFYEVLQLKGSFDYPFSKLENIGKIYSADRNIRVYTWNIPFGTENLFFGIIQYYSKSEKKHLLLKLNDHFPAENETVLHEWKEALYYEVVETKSGGQKYYTLLGFNMHDALSNKKRIDVISIDESDRLYFCEKVIQYNGKLVDNLEFQYNEKAMMSLRYNHEAKMIVFDHLSPSKSSLKDNYEFYGPDFTYDGLKFEKGIWVHYKNIDITN